MLPDDRFGNALFIGSYWTRDNRIEVDLVGGTEQVSPKTIDFVGSIKWRSHGAFGNNDLAALSASLTAIPGTSERTRFVGVSRTGFTSKDLDVTLEPDDLIAAWRS
jgi:hypothetical protein